MLGEGINNLLDVRRNVLSDTIHDALCEGDEILSDRFANALQCDFSPAGEVQLVTLRARVWSVAPSAR